MTTASPPIALAKPTGVSLGRLVRLIFSAAAVLALLYAVVLVYATGQTLLAVVLLVAVAAGAWLFLVPGRRTYPYRYLFPGLLGIGLFILFPLLYTVGIAFTNFSGQNLLSYERARGYLLDQTFLPEGARPYAFTLHRTSDGLLVALAQDERRFAAPLPDADAPGEIGAEPVASDVALGEPLPIREVIANRPVLQAVVVRLPDGERAAMTGLREFAARQPLYEELHDGALRDRATGTVLTPNFETGFFVDESGNVVHPGFVAGAGFDNFLHILTNPSIQRPFLRIFAWTVVFSALTVVFVTTLGVGLAVLLSWEDLRFRAFYRVMLVLPYAVPNFISILIFRGLFNENFGEINAVLSGLFGIRPHWFTDPLLAKATVLIVNTWLGYPYFMLLCLGLVQVIPKDIYESSAIDGAGPLTNFFRLTLPLVLRPLAPLMVAAFAFNFNNFVLINLLTFGGPDIIGSRPAAGETDLLVSYTYRMAFRDASQDFALAAAIATCIFVLVGLLSWVNLRLTKPQFD